MNRNYVSLQVVEYQYYKARKYVISGLLLYFVLLFFYISFINKKPLIPLGILILSLIVIKLLFKNPYKKIANIEISEDSIQVHSTNSIEKYNINEINEFTLHYDGYKGKWEFYQDGPDTGLNRIEFTYKYNTFKYEVIINEADLKQLKNLLLSWRTNGVNVNIKSFWHSI